MTILLNKTEPKFKDMNLQEFGLSELKAEESQNVEGGFLPLLMLVAPATLGLALVGVSIPWVSGWNAYE